MKKRRIRLELKFCQICACLIYLFYSCQSNIDRSSNMESYLCSGTACGKVGNINGNVIIFTKIDTSSYLVIKLRKDLSTIKEGKFSLLLSDTLLMKNSDVFVLDFDTKLKVYENVVGDIKGYVYPCSDIISGSHIPDTMNFTGGKIDIQVQELLQKKQRDYYVELNNMTFSKASKVKKIDSFKRKIIFTQ